MSRLSNDPSVVAEAAALINASLVGSPEVLPAEYTIDDVVDALVALGFVTVAGA